MAPAKLSKSIEISKSNKNNIKRRKNKSAAQFSNKGQIFSKALNVFRSVSIPNQKPSTPLPKLSRRGQSSQNSSSVSQTEYSLSATTIVQRVSADSKPVRKQSTDNNTTTQINQVDVNHKPQITSQLLVIRECKDIIENFIRMQNNSEEARSLAACTTADLLLDSNLAVSTSNESLTSTELDIPSAHKPSMYSSTGSQLINPPKFASSSLDSSSINYNDINAVFIEVINKLYHLNDKVPQLLLQHYSQNDKIYKKQMLRLFGDSYYDSQYAIRANGRNYSHNAESATDDRTRTVRNEKDAKFYKSLGKRHNRYIGKYTFEELLNRKEATLQLCHAFVEAKHSFIYQQGNSLCVRHTPIYYSHNKGSSQVISLDSTRRSYVGPKVRSKSQSFGQFKHFTKTVTVDNTGDGEKQRRDSLSSTMSDDAKDVVFNLSRSHFSEQNLLARRQAASIHSFSAHVISPMHISLPSDGILRVGDEMSHTYASNNNLISHSHHNNELNVVHDDRSYKLRAMDAMMKLTSFDFDVFEFDVLTNGQSLSTLFPIIMEQLLFFDSGSNYSLRDSLTGHSVSGTVLSNSSASDSSASSKNNEMIFNQDIVLNLITKIENQYNDFNPFYNRIHTSQMLCDCYFWLNQFDSTEINSLKQEDRLVILISSLIINLGYPGVNNSMLTAMNHDLAQIYNNQFVTENYAIAQFFYILKHQSLNIFGKLQNKNKNKFKQIKKKIIQCVINSNQTQRSQLTQSMKESSQEIQRVHNLHRMRKAIGSESIINDENTASNGKQKNGCKLQRARRMKPKLANLWKKMTHAEKSSSPLSAIALPADIADASKPDMLLVDNKDTVSKKLKKFKRALSTKTSKMMRLQSRQQTGLMSRQVSKKDSSKNRSLKNKAKAVEDAKKIEKNREILRDAIVHTSKYGYFCKNLKLHKEWSERYFQQQLISSNVFEQMMRASLHKNIHTSSSSHAMNRCDFPAEMIDKLMSAEGFTAYFQAFAEFIDSKHANNIVMDMNRNNEHWSLNEQAKVAYQGECDRYPNTA